MSVLYSNFFFTFLFIRFLITLFKKSVSKKCEVL